MYGRISVTKVMAWCFLKQDSLKDDFLPDQTNKGKTIMWEIVLLR